MVIFLTVAPSSSAGPVLDGDAIVRRSTVENRADWAAAPHYAYTERARDDEGTKTYAVSMILGSSYKRLVKDSDQPLSPERQASEERKLDKEIATRGAESPSERARRIAEYQEDREKAHRILEEMPRAFEYTLTATRRVGSRTLYVLRAIPRKGYEPPDVAARILTAMRGE